MDGEAMDDFMNPQDAEADGQHDTAGAETTPTTDEDQGFIHHASARGSNEPSSSGGLQLGNVPQMPRVLKESPQFGFDLTILTDAQPRIGRSGSLPDSHQRPNISILKKAKTESFVERPKILRFAPEVEVKDISPCSLSPCSPGSSGSPDSPCSPSSSGSTDSPGSPGSPGPLAQAVVVGTPLDTQVDPTSIQWLQQLEYLPQSMAQPAQQSAEADSPNHLPKKPSMGVGFRPASAQSQAAQAASSKTASWGRMARQPSRSSIDETPGQPSAGVTLMQASAEHAAAREEVSNMATSAPHVKQPVQHDLEAEPPEKPAMEEGLGQTSAQHQAAQPASSKTTNWGRMARQPSRSSIEETPGKPSAGVTRKVSVEHQAAGCTVSKTATSASSADQFVQHGLQANTAGKPSAGLTLRQVIAQHEAAGQEMSKMATSATGFRQTMQNDGKADSPKKPSVEEGFGQASAQNQAAPAASSKTTGWGRTAKQPSRSSIEDTSGKTSAASRLRQVNAHREAVLRAVSKLTTSGSLEEATPGKPSAGSTSSQTSLQQEAAGQTVSKTTTQSNKAQPIGAYPIGASVSNEPTICHATGPRPEGETQLESANIVHRLLLDNPKLGLDLGDAVRPRIGRAGSLPVSQLKPSSSILKKSNTETFGQRPKTLRFAREVEVRDISPCRPSSPNENPRPPSRAVAPNRPRPTVPTPVDPSSIQWLQQLGHGSMARTLAAQSARLSGHARGPHLAPIAEGSVMDRTRSSSLSLLPDLPDSPGTESPDAFKVKIERQGGADENRSARGSQASGFLVWKEANACDSNPRNEERFQNPIAAVAQYFHQMMQPRAPQELAGPPGPPALQTTVNCMKELTEMYNRQHDSHHRRKSRKHHEQTPPPSPHQSGCLENIPSFRAEHAHRVAYFHHGHLTPDLEKRVLERAYFNYINGVSEDQEYNYLEALRIELGH